MDKAGYYAHTNPLFMKSRVLKCNDLLYFKIMQLTCRAETKSVQILSKASFQYMSVNMVRDVCKFAVPKPKKGI